MTQGFSRRSLIRDAGVVSAAMLTGAHGTAHAQNTAPGGDGAGSAPRPPSGFLRMGANENPYGPSESAIKAMTAAMADGWKYAGEEMATLTKLIAAREGVDPDHILITEGSAEILRITPLLYAPAGSEMVAASPTFEQGPDYARAIGGTVLTVPLDKDMKHDLAAMEARITNRTGLVYVCNPNNPTATMVEARALRSFIDTVSPRAMVLVDEAYIDLIDDPDGNAMVDRVKAGKNVIVARTFSKIHGMAGLRLGFAIARPDIIRRMNSVRMSMNNRMGLAAGIASYQDKEFMDFSRKKIREAMTMTAAALDDLGINYTKSQANFLMFDTGHPVREFMVAMRQKGVAVGRPFPPYDTWCRVSMAKVEQMPQFLDALKNHFKKA